MRDHILTVIANTTDPFAVEIQYHRPCWKSPFIALLTNNMGFGLGFSDSDCRTRHVTSSIWSCIDWLTEEYLALFNINETMVKVQKSKLVEMLNLIPFQTVDSCIALIDMGFIWRLATPFPEDREKDDEIHFI